MTNHFAPHVLVFLATQFVTACNAKTNDDNAIEGVPELAAVEMQLTGDAGSEGTATVDDAVDAATLAANELEELAVPDATAATDLRQIRGAVKELNDSLRDFLGHVAALVRSEEPTYRVGALRMWGPQTRGATEYRFFLRHGLAHHWAWRLDARVADSNEAFARVAAGEITVGAHARRGVGAMGFDLSALAAVDPTVTAQGQLLVGFRHGDRGTSVGYAARDLTRDPEVRAGIDALMRAVHLKDGRNRVRLAFRGNMEGTLTTAEELVLTRVRHHRGVGGRSDLVAIEGDIPAGEALVVSQCWNDALEEVFRASRRCPSDGLGGERCNVTQTTGDSSACPSLLQAAELPPVDATATMPDDEDPHGDVTPPEAIPTVEGDTSND